MHSVGSNPPWKELPADIAGGVLSHTNPLTASRFSIVCKQWNQAVTSAPIWQFLSRCHFPSLSPELFKSFQDYHRYYSNLLKGVCSVKTLREHTGPIPSLGLKGETLFSSSHDDKIKIWDLKTNTCTATLQGRANRSCALAVEENALFSNSSDGTIEIWDLNSNTCTATLTENMRPAYALISGDAKLFSGSSDGTIKIWNLKDNTCTATLTEYSSEITCLALKEKIFFSGSYNGQIKIWNLNDNTCTTTLQEENTVHFLTLGEGVLFSANGRKIRIWDLKDNTCIATLLGHTEDVQCLALNGATLFSGSYDHTIKIWDLTTHTCTATLFEHNDWVSSLVSKDLTLFSSSFDETIKIWDFTAGHAQIFTEIANALEDQGQAPAKLFAINMFLKMPKAAKNKIFGELYKILKPTLKRNYWKCAEDAFYGHNGQSATNSQKAKAIRNYLNKLSH
jgi:WD40 repeat protein